MNSVFYSVREVSVSEPCGIAYEVVRNDGFVKRVIRFYEDALEAAKELNNVIRLAGK